MHRDQEELDLFILEKATGGSALFFSLYSISFYV